MLTDGDTIVAEATPAGRGGIGVVRVSGPLCGQIARLVTGRLPTPRLATLCRFSAAGEDIDEGIALYFPGPASFTGEDVLELQGHGGPVVMAMLVDACLSAGARLARPGEFTERAFLNDKLDLAQAEAVADLIDSLTVSAARSALRSLQGEFSARVGALLNSLTGLRIHVEAAMDFPEEEIDFLADQHIATALDGLIVAVAQLLERAERGALLRDGANLVLAGRPNAGKSSLMNRLTGRDTAIVTSIPGTTRDVIEDTIDIAGIPVRISDTAGLRDASDEIEAEGVRRARLAMTQADHVLLLVDSAAEQPAKAAASLLEEVAGQFSMDQCTVVFNKADLALVDPAVIASTQGVAVSAVTGEGVDELLDQLARRLEDSSGETTFTARQRHLDALRSVSARLHQARDRLQEGLGELMAEDLRDAQQALGSITGEVTSDDLLGMIFASFCIGK